MKDNTGKENGVRFQTDLGVPVSTLDFVGNKDLLNNFKQRNKSAHHLTDLGEISVEWTQSSCGSQALENRLWDCRAGAREAKQEAG